jgi:hypothetical protein
MVEYHSNEFKNKANFISVNRPIVVGRTLNLRWLNSGVQYMKMGKI